MLYRLNMSVFIRFTFGHKTLILIQTNTFTQWKLTISLNTCCSIGHITCTALYALVWTAFWFPCHFIQKYSVQALIFSHASDFLLSKVEKNQSIVCVWRYILSCHYTYSTYLDIRCRKEFRCIMWASNIFPNTNTLIHIRKHICKLNTRRNIFLDDLLNKKHMQEIEERR